MNIHVYATCTFQINCKKDDEWEMGIYSFPNNLDEIFARSSIRHLNNWKNITAINIGQLVVSILSSQSYEILNLIIS